MQIVRFSFEKEKDLWNVWRACNVPSHEDEVAKFISFDAIKVARGSKFEDCAYSLEVIYGRKLPTVPVDSFLRGIRESWGAIEQQFIQRLVRMTRKNFPFMNLNAYLTLIQSCSYNPDERFFMVSIRNSLLEALRSIGQDLFILHFSKYYLEDLERELGREKAHKILNALLALISIEFSDLWMMRYELDSRNELECFVVREWKREGDFDLLIKKLIAKERNGQLLLS